MLIIGDVHGKTNQYKELINHFKGNSVCVGDFGFQKHHDWHIENIDGSKHKINFGNHDYMPYVNKSHSTGNFSYDKATGIFTVRGAWSTDKYMRTEGLDWFADEELDYSQMLEAVFAYEEAKPDIMITHDCPHEIRRLMYGIESKCITCNGLQSMFERHKPKMWIYGHHHFSETRDVLGTRFKCLAELETILI